METGWLWLVILGEMLFTAAFFFILPAISRRGLLFGVYVGEERSVGEEAQGIRRQWYVGMLVALIVSLAVALVLGLSFPAVPVGPLASIFVLLAGYLVLYLRAYFEARGLAAPEVPKAVAPLIAEEPAGLVLPLLAVVVGLAGGLVSVAYAAACYDLMPPRVPTHFGISGRPDAWAPRSFWSVMALPIGALVMGPVLGVVAMLTARAKRAVRYADGGVSLGAQLRFRRAMTRFLSGVAMLTTLMLTLMSVSATRTAIGAAEGMPPALTLLVLAMLVYALGGSLYVALRYGQGGARLERAASAAPLTDGLADNAHWYLGAFYVNRDDPSFFVEHRFGLGYTLNFGNPRALAFLGLFFAGIIAVIVISLLAG